MTLETFIFANKPWVRFCRHASFWLVFYGFSLASYFHDFLDRIGFSNWMLLQSLETLLHILTQMLFCYPVIYFLLPRYLHRKKYAAFGFSLVAWSALIYFVYFLVHIILFSRIHAMVGLKFRPPELVYWFTLISFISYFPVSTGLALALKTCKNWYAKRLENQQLFEENSNAELQLLKAQIHPHFLFNTLNNIYSFTLKKADESPALIRKLSDTLRYMIQDCDAYQVSLKKELDMIQDYMELEKIRYGSRLTMEIDIQGNTETKIITPLLMIPLIENSFKHGTSQMLKHPWIVLRINAASNWLNFQLTNSKPYSHPSTSVKGGIGLLNVKKRLQLLYPEKHQLHIVSNDESFSVNMKIPLGDIHQNPSKTHDHQIFPDLQNRS
jgi:LytS/YehU family sensor histidine kinase